MDWFQIGQGVCQDCILSLCLFNLYAEYIMWNARLEEAQARIKIFRRNINNFRYADNITLMAECEVKWSEVAQSCPTLCDPVDCTPPGSSVHGILQARILQARILEWVAISFSRGSSWTRDRTQVSRIRGRYFNLWATREATSVFHNSVNYFPRIWQNVLSRSTTGFRNLDKGREGR